jgi:hypothetical protein
MVNYIDTQGNLQFGSDILPFTSMSAVSAVSNGTGVDGGVMRLNHSMAVTTSAGVSAGVVQIQGSLDGTNWFNMPTTSSVTTNAASTTFLVTPPACPARFVRAAITTTITGGTITAVVGSV